MKNISCLVFDNNDVLKDLRIYICDARCATIKLI